MKSCTKCKRSDVEFHKNKSKPDGLQSICKLCKKEVGKKYFQDSKKHHHELNILRKQETRQWIVEYFLLHLCIDCGEKDPVVLEFDHRSDKTMEISDMLSLGYSIPKIELEIAKCDVRCANCHRRKTAKDFGWYKNVL